MYSLLSDSRICQVCKRMFPNGKALGGHMRSHTRTEKLSVLSRKSHPGASSSTAPPLQMPNIPAGASFNPSETVLVRSVHASEAIVGAKPDLTKEGGEEETSGKRKFLWDLNEVCPTESQSSITDEEAASCLLELSESSVKPTDCTSATRKGKEKVEYIEIEDDVDVDDEETYYRYLDKDEGIKEENVKIVTPEDKKETEVEPEDKDEDKDDELYSVANEKKGKKRYKCDLCGKVLRSYQALGGHRTSHTNKRVKMLLEKNGGEGSNPQDGPVVRRHFECEICGKVFTTGQALGGHKKVHYVFLKPCKEA